MSLRARLLLATVTLVGVGLVAASASTYTLLRSSLIERVDEQLIGARSIALATLTDQRRRGPDFNDQQPRGAPLATVAFLLDPSGQVIASAYFGFAPPGGAPELPAGLPGSAINRSRVPRFLTVDATSPGLEYRVLADAVGRGGTLVVATPLEEVETTLGRLLLLETLVSVAVLAAVAALAHWLVRLGLRPLEAMAGTADKIAGGELSHRVEPAGDHTEVGRLGSALNSMLERIETAFAERRASEEKLRRFISDASHELRTPLTSIRGYSELFRRGAKANRADLEKSMRRIEEESARMGSMVDELLLLARLDQGRPLHMEQVDLARIVADSVQDARAGYPGSPISVEFPDELVIKGDEDRLRQVVTNLLNNALTHTPAGTPVKVTVARHTDQAVLEVTDEGPGIDANDLEHLFDRFYRADASRSRGQGGAGLGLSIVDAIVQAHGGRVSASSEVGSGARFVVTLPLGSE